VRAALFSSLGELVPGAAALDLFAGSGAMGLEAASRGAGRVCWVERDPVVFGHLKQNIVSLLGSSSDKFQAVRGDVFVFLRRGGAGSPFDIVFADPPYIDAEKADGFYQACFELLGDRILKRDGVFVIEHARRFQLRVGSGWRVLKNKIFGDTAVAIFQKTGGAADEQAGHISRDV